MLCQNCQHADATTHLKRITNGEYTEIHLCSECAAALGVTDVFPGFGSAFGDLLGAAFPATDMKRVGNRVLRCEVCGFTFDDIARTGKPGCPNCYRVFGEKLKPSLQKLHGRAAVHMGKVPNGASEETRREHRLSQLKEQLNAAIDEQNFEKAAQLRDELRRLSAEGAQS